MRPEGLTDDEAWEWVKSRIAKAEAFAKTAPPAHRAMVARFKDKPNSCTSGRLHRPSRTPRQQRV